MNLICETETQLLLFLNRSINSYNLFIRWKLFFHFKLLFLINIILFIIIVWWKFWGMIVNNFFLVFLIFSSFYFLRHTFICSHHNSSLLLYNRLFLLFFKISTVLRWLLGLGLRFVLNRSLFNWPLVFINDFRLIKVFLLCFTRLLRNTMSFFLLLTIFDFLRFSWLCFKLIRWFLERRRLTRQMLLLLR